MAASRCAKRLKLQTSKGGSVNFGKQTFISSFKVGFFARGLTRLSESRDFLFLERASKQVHIIVNNFQLFYFSTRFANLL